MNIGIIGSGMIGGTVGPLWAKAGHRVLYASRHPENLAQLVRDTGHGARAGSPAEAAAFGEAVLLAVPFGATPDLGKAVGNALRGKVVLDAGNPYPSRDGAVATEVLKSGRGSGPFTAAALPGARVVRAFNSVYFEVLKREAHRAGDQVGVPLAGDDADALAVAEELVRDAGFDPVVVGGLETSARFDVGTPVYNTGMSGPALRRALGL
ncbi:MAG TPA: NADPH-dependent F420 reductase [Myxococcaceae bacterium]|nr:NADPH-dependent F420 reductase [Myxococcaceae bacterium]